MTINLLTLTPLVIVIWLVTGRLTINQWLIFLIGVCSLKTLYTLLQKNGDIVITEDKKMLGSQKVNSKKYNEQHFVSLESVNFDSLNNRSILDKCLGNYEIADKSGESFKLNKFYFSKEKFTNIKQYLKNILNIAI